MEKSVGRLLLNIIKVLKIWKYTLIEIFKNLFELTITVRVDSKTARLPL